MKRFFILQFAVVLGFLALSAQSSETFTEGYVFTANLQAHKSKSLKSTVTSTIRKGRVAVASENNEWWFYGFGAAEYIKLDSGSFYRYYPPAQDDLPAEYVSASAFKKSVRKVKISSKVPADWEVGKVYTFRPAADEDMYPFTVRLIRLSGSKVTLVTDVDYENNFKPISTIDISGQIIVELKFNENTVYVFNGKPLSLARDLHSFDYSSLVVDDNGVTYAKGEGGTLRADGALSYTFGEQYELDGYRWISGTEMVIGDTLYVLSR